MDFSNVRTIYYLRPILYYHGYNFYALRRYFFLSAQIFFVTKFVIHITKFLIRVTKFVIHVTKFVTNFFLYDSKKYLAESKKYLRDHKKILGDNRHRPICRPAVYCKIVQAQRNKFAWSIVITSVEMGLFNLCRAMRILRNWRAAACIKSKIERS